MLIKLVYLPADELTLREKMQNNKKVFSVIFATVHWRKKKQEKKH